MALTETTGPVKFAAVNAVSGDNTLVAAVTGKKIRVLGLVLVATAATSVTLESDTGGTALSGLMPLAANSEFVLPASGLGYVETVAGELLSLNSSADDVDGVLVYQEVS